MTDKEADDKARKYPTDRKKSGFAIRYIKALYRSDAILLHGSDVVAYLAEQRLLRQRLNVDGSPDEQRAIVVDAGVIAPIDETGSDTSEAKALGIDETRGCKECGAGYANDRSNSCTQVDVSNGFHSDKEIDS